MDIGFRRRTHGGPCETAALSALWTHLGSDPAAAGGVPTVQKLPVGSGESRRTREMTTNRAEIHHESVTSEDWAAWCDAAIDDIAGPGAQGDYETLYLK